MNELILGLLMMGNLTTYDIRKSIQSGMNMLSTDSMGNIHAAIKKLLGNGYITFEELVSNGKFKKVYSITPEGREYFYSWINSPFEVNHKRQAESKKLFFMSFSDKENRGPRIKEYVDAMKVEKEELTKILNQAVLDLEALPEELKEIGKFQFLTIQYGLDMIDFEIKWYEQLLEKVEE